MTLHSEKRCEHNLFRFIVALRSRVQCCCIPHVALGTSKGAEITRIYYMWQIKVQTTIQYPNVRNEMLQLIETATSYSWRHSHRHFIVCSILMSFLSLSFLVKLFASTFLGAFRSCVLAPVSLRLSVCLLTSPVAQWFYVFVGIYMCLQPSLLLFEWNLWLNLEHFTLCLE